ncbi:MAG: V-type ATP synthase subunit D [Simkaniaceae bacterium]|nr:V-type ATP synthase subunit D [Simkaniaceae bacterium]
MSEIRLTKNELRDQQHKLVQLQRYLPTLQLKKAMLQSEVGAIQQHIHTLEKEFDQQKSSVLGFISLVSEGGMKEFFNALNFKDLKTSSENIAGVEIPVLEGIEFEESKYSHFVTPIWWDSALKHLRQLLLKKQHVKFAQQKKELLEAELRSVSIRVNLFEKILIPRTLNNIKKIKVFLGDQQLSAVATSKIAKMKTLLKKKSEVEELV